MSATVDLHDPFGPQMGGENQSKIHPEAIEKAIVFLITFGIDFWSDLVPSWPHVGATTIPNCSQFGFKIDPSRSVDLRFVFEKILVQCVVQFCSKHHIAEGTSVL